MIRQFRHFGANGWTVQIKLIKALDVAEIVFGSVEFADNALTGSSIGQTGTGIFERDDSRFAFRQSTGFIKGNTLQASAFF